MTNRPLAGLDDAEAAACSRPDPDAGIGALRTTTGNLPLEQLVVRARIVGLNSRVVLTQTFRSPHDSPVEATYVFPLPDRAAVTELRMTADDRIVSARLRERGEARAEYDQAIASGRRASIAEEERPDVFTLRVGNILPGEVVQVELTTVGVLPVADGVATFRFPLVVAPRYIPGRALEHDMEQSAGAGWHPDTDAVPDASRISPPVLLPGFPNPVGLDAEIAIDPAGLEMGEPRSSLHAVRTEAGVVRIDPGARPDRDIVLRIPLGDCARTTAALTLVPDDDGTEGTFQLTVLPPDLGLPGRPRDVVLVLDRSGSMSGWKMVAARRAAARIVDTLTEHDRFAVLAFDHSVETPATLPAGLVPGSDRNRFRSVEFLAALSARGRTELSEPLGRALALLGADDPGRDRVLVLVTDGQVGNEDQLLRAHGPALGRAAVRVHTVGIDQAVNAGFLGQLAGIGGGRCELVESEDRLDEAMAQIHRRIGAPLVTDARLELQGIDPVPGSLTPARLPDVFAGVPYLVRGRYRAGGGQDMLARRVVAVLGGNAPDGTPFATSADAVTRAEPAVRAAWARGRLRDLEDAFVTAAGAHHSVGVRTDREELEREIVATSLRFGVLCRFTAFVAVDERVVTDGSAPRSIVQPVSLPNGWDGWHPLVVGVRAAASAPAQAGILRATRASMSFEPMSSEEEAPAGFPTPMPRSRRRPPEAPPSPAAGRPGDALLHQLLRTEARRLRALTAEPGYRRREALLDLGSRLAGLHGRDTDPRWRELLDLLRPERVAAEPVDELTRRVLELLEALTGSGA